jgi:cephalosporin hydroxylase
MMPNFFRFLMSAVTDPKIALSYATRMSDAARAHGFACTIAESPRSSVAVDREPSQNPLKEYFKNNVAGPGIWKWEHYFDAYERHFSKFRGTNITVLEIGIYSGGSLPMWRQYFGEQSKIVGVDIEEACRTYEGDRISIQIGDQENRDFWSGFRKQHPEIHVLIDDGGHTPEQQMVTLEEMLPYMPTGSVYVCEDIHGATNRFSTFASSLVNNLNATESKTEDQSGFYTGEFQRTIHSLHFYPFLCVIEKQVVPIQKLEAPRQGTVWQPFL